MNTCAVKLNVNLYVIGHSGAQSGVLILAVVHFGRYDWVLRILMRTLSVLLSFCCL